MAGILGHSYALVADAIESSTDIFSSLIVWGGLRVTTRPADEDDPYGHGKAESLAGAVVALMLIGAALSIAIVAVREIVTPHHTPAPFTLVVVAGVVVIKEVLFRKVLKVGQETGSTAVKADAWHHRSDATHLGRRLHRHRRGPLGRPRLGVGRRLGGARGERHHRRQRRALLRPAIRDLMDRMPDGEIVEQIEAAARAVEGVRDIEKLRVRKAAWITSWTSTSRRTRCSRSTTPISSAARSREPSGPRRAPSPTSSFTWNPTN